jgi:hypothetical protein
VKATISAGSSRVPRVRNFMCGSSVMQWGYGLRA